MAEFPDLVDGIHYGISFEDYVRLPAMNATTLKHGVDRLGSAAHLKAAIDGLLNTDSGAKKVGRALHCRVLEPDCYDERFTISPGCQAIISKGRSKGHMCGNFAQYLVPTSDGDKWLCGVHKPRELCDEPFENVLSMEQARNVERAAESIRRHPIARFINARGGFEATAISSVSGIRKKCRMDKFIPRQGNNPPIIVDLKKTRKGRATKYFCQKDSRDYGYDVSAAWYCDTVAEIIGEVPQFVFVFVEETAPHDLFALQLNSRDVRCGRARYAQALERYNHGIKTGEWPGVSGMIETGLLDDGFLESVIG